MRPLAGASTTAVDDFLEKSACVTVERRATAAALEEPAVVDAMQEERIAIGEGNSKIGIGRGNATRRGKGVGEERGGRE